MKSLFVFLVLFVSQTTFACDLKGLRKDIFGHFSKEFPVTNKLGEKQGSGTLSEITLSDSVMNIRGENFYITKLVFDILWANGQNEKKEILMAAIVDLATCRLESFESGEVVGSSATKK